MVRSMLADDLTGAADAAVHFAGTRAVEIFLPTPAHNWTQPADFGLVVLDTETRNLVAELAAEQITFACQGLGQGVFKKVDSTLRGSVAAELAAARMALGLRTAVLAPSLPAQGRVVEAGRLLVGGSVVGSVAEILGFAVVPVPIEALAEGDLAPLVSVDAISDADLDRIAAACAVRQDLLPAGSAGLAAAFARLEGSTAPTAVLPHRRVLVAVASRHPASKVQLMTLAAEPHSAIEVLAIPVDAAGAPDLLDAWLGEAVRDRVSSGDAVLATGGDAAMAVCRALGIGSIRPRAEIFPGVVWSETDRQDIGLATKAGGFGAPRLLLDAALKLLGVEPHG